MKTYNLQLTTYNKIILAIFGFSLLLLPLLTNAAVDSDCTSRGGVCQINTQSCQGGGYQSGLCAGTTERQCCIKSGTSGTIKNQPGGTFGDINNPSGGQQSIKISNPLQANTIQELIDRVVRWMLMLGTALVPLFIIIGAFQIMSAAGNPENITKGRHTITYTIAGYILLLIATGLTALITNILGTK